MKYLAVLDYKHLDNGIFLSSFARSLSQQKKVHPIIVHSDSEYTERIIQTGVMREEAIVRSIKDLNHRLIALFADEGISTVGLNGYQRAFITKEKNQLNLDYSYFQTLPHQSVLLLSSLALDPTSGKAVPVPLASFAQFIRTQLETKELFLFSASDSDEVFSPKKQPSRLMWRELDQPFKETYIPTEFHHFQHPVRLTTAREFQKIPSLDSTTSIR